jgi:hypothetical protein
MHRCTLYAFSFICVFPFRQYNPVSDVVQVDERVCFSGFGMHSDEANWLGHGKFFRPRPADSLEPITNMASNCMTDYDVLEAGFVNLKKVRILSWESPLFSGQVLAP